MADLYIIRAQGLGYLTDAIFEGPPSEEQMRAVLMAELREHCISPKDGQPRERWVRAVKLPILKGDGASHIAELSGTVSAEKLAALRAARDASPAPGAAVAEQPAVAFAGVGHVTNPGE